MQVIALTLEDVVLLHADFDVQVSGWPAIGSGFAIASTADAHAAVYARRDFDFERLLLLDAALALTGHAWLGNNLACAAASRAGLLHAKEALAHLHRARAGTGAAGLDLGAGFGTTALADFAGVPSRNADLRVFATRCFFQRDFHRVTQVTTAEHLAAPGAGAAAALLAEHITKNITKGFCKATVALATGAAHIGVYTRVTMLVVGRALLRVRQHFIGFLGFLELVFGHFARITLVAVRVVFHRKFAIRLFDVFVRGVFRNTQNFVKVSFSCHGCPTVLVSKSLRKLDAKRRADDSD